MNTNPQGFTMVHIGQLRGGNALHNSLRIHKRGRGGDEAARKLIQKRHEAIATLLCGGGGGGGDAPGSGMGLGSNDAMAYGGGGEGGIGGNGGEGRSGGNGSVDTSEGSLPWVPVEDRDEVVSKVLAHPCVVSGDAGGAGAEGGGKENLFFISIVGSELRSFYRFREQQRQQQTGGTSEAVNASAVAGHTRGIAITPAPSSSSSSSSPAWTLCERDQWRVADLLRHLLGAKDTASLVCRVLELWEIDCPTPHAIPTMLARLLLSDG